jgi:ribose/xylose/arabinose/galactoside ABC-type transport system permease subunit
MTIRPVGGLQAGPAPVDPLKSSARAPAAIPERSWGVSFGGLLDLIGRNVALSIFLALIILASLFVPNFADADNWAVILKQSAIPAIAAIGMTMVLMTGGIDLSLGYVVGLASIMSGIMANTWLWPAPAVLGVSLILGLAVGLCNGLITQFMRVPAFITTLGTGYVVYGLAQIVSDGSIINRLPKGLLAIGRTPIFGLPSAVFLALGAAAVFHIIISRAIFGRQLKAFGLGARAAALSGVPCAQINVSVYALCGALAALSGLLFTIRVNAAQPNMGGGAFTFEVVTAAIVGGTSLFGGVGSVANSVLGVLSIKIIENCINLLGVSYHLYLAVQGAIILVAIVAGNLTNRGA